jgi:hypothetical protein
MATPAALPSASVTINGKHVPVTGSHASIKLDDVLAAAPFKDWVAAMDPELFVHSVSVTDVDYFGSRVGFIKMRADVEFHGQRVPGIVFLRGGAVAILVVLRCEGERWVVCCRQPRVPVGRSGFLEIPAGMLDGSGHFAGVAAKVRPACPVACSHPRLHPRTAVTLAGRASSPAPRNSPPSPCRRRAAGAARRNRYRDHGRRAH